MARGSRAAWVKDESWGQAEEASLPLESDQFGSLNFYGRPHPAIPRFHAPVKSGITDQGNATIPSYKAAGSF